MLAGEPAETAAERIAEHSDIVGRACKCGEPVLRRGVADLLPDRPGLDACAAIVRIDVDPMHPRRAKQDRAREVAERCGRVTRALRCDTETVGACRQNGLGDVGRRLREHDGGGPLVDGEVPGSASFVPALVVGPVEVAVEAFLEGIDRTRRRAL